MERRAEIQDQGIGIPEEMREKIFTLYFTTKKAGSGIGLAMAYRVIAAAPWICRLSTRSRAWNDL